MRNRVLIDSTRHACEKIDSLNPMAETRAGTKQESHPNGAPNGALDGMQNISGTLATYVVSMDERGPSGGGVLRKIETYKIL
jgi:hypothetical protein